MRAAPGRGSAPNPIGAAQALDIFDAPIPFTERLIRQMDADEGGLPPLTEV